HRFTIVLSRLRQLFKQLGLQFEKYVETTRDWVLFAPERPFTFDRNQFVAQSLAGLKTEDLPTRELLLKQALRLYRAELFEGIYAQWCLTEREYLARLRLRVLGQLMYCCLQQDTFAEAIEFGHLILQEEPLREETHRALMHCYQQQNRPDLAAHQYFACQALLESELQTQPLPETTQLFTEIMVQRAQSSLTSESVSPAQQENIQKAYNNFLAAARQLAQSF
ncbi:MAG: bacterial transcriptional activator domain-containing protein, partial [Chloroflexota bacterium]